MENATMAQLQDRFRLEISSLRLERQAEENKAALRQAKFDLRTAQQEQLLYNGSLRSFADRLSGKKEERETALRHGVQKAESDLTSAQQASRRLELQLSEVHARLEALPSWDTLREQPDPEARKEWHRLEALLCMEALLPLLDVGHGLLMERRNQFNGTYAGQVKSWQTLAEIYSAPEAAGEACKPILLRLKAALDELQIPFELHSYFDAPTAFLSCATQYTRMDRINTAISQVASLQRLIPKLQKQLED